MRIQGQILSVFFFKFFYLCVFGCAGCSLPAGFSLVGASGSHPLVAACGLLIAVASLVAERRL